MGSRLNLWRTRAEKARDLGALAYVPSETAVGGEAFEENPGARIHG